MYDGLVILLLPLVACFIVILAGAPQLGGWTFLTVGLAAVVAEHIRARSRGEAHGSILMRFLAPRTYRGARRILLIVAATTLPASLTLAGSADVATLVFACALIYVVDRMVPVVNPPENISVSGGGTSPWLWRVGVLGVAGFASLIFVAALPGILGSSELQSKVAEVRQGKRLVYGFLNPFALAEPRADPVTVRWIGASTPRPFGDRRAAQLTYFGQNGGTSVFFDATARRPTVYRLPTAAITIQTSPRSVVTSDPQRPPSTGTGP